MTYGVILEAVDSLYNSKAVKDELEQKKQEMIDIITKGISNHKIPECSMTYSIVSHEAIKNKERLD